MYERRPTALIDEPGMSQVLMQLANPTAIIEGPATESMIGGATVKVILNSIEQLQSQFTKWYLHQQKVADFLVKKVHGANKDRISFISQTIKGLNRNKAALRKKSRDRSLPQDERDQARREYERTDIEIGKLIMEYKELTDNIFIPNAVSEIYGPAVSAYAAYEKAVDAEVKAFDDFNDERKWYHEDDMSKIRDAAKTMLESVMSHKRSLESADKTIRQAYQMIVKIPGGEPSALVKYPIQNFQKLGRLLKGTKDTLSPCLSRLAEIRNELRSLNYGDQGDPFVRERYLLETRAVSCMLFDATQYWKDRFGLESAVIGRANFPVHDPKENSSIGSMK